MSDTASIGLAQHVFWNSEATRRWVTEQARIDRLMADVTEAALAAAAPKRGERVLDVGCGTGSTVLRLAEGVGPSGRVLGVDISEQQLALARERVAAAGVNQAQLVLRRATHHFAPETFDLGFSRFGVMFFPDPAAAFRNIRGAMKRSGRLLLAVFRTGLENPWATASVAALSHLVPPPAIGAGGAGPVQLERPGAGQAYSRWRGISKRDDDAARPIICDRTRCGRSCRIRDLHRSGSAAASWAASGDSGGGACSL